MWSRKASPLAASITGSGTGGSIASSSELMAIEEMTWPHPKVRSVPSGDLASTAVARPREWRTLVTGTCMWISEPEATTLSRQTSHIIPGPYFGYWNSSISEVISFWFRFGMRALTMALPSDSSFTRWAAQSAGIELTGTPQTFSV
jgi:hypothetical protein